METPKGLFTLFIGYKMIMSSLGHGSFVKKVNLLAAGREVKVPLRSLSNLGRFFFFPTQMAILGG